VAFGHLPVFYRTWRPKFKEEMREGRDGKEM
jgi:hypothetical protein